MKVGDEVRVKKGSPGYQLWYKGKKGMIVGITTNDEGEKRYLVHLPGSGLLDEEITLPFAECELELEGGYDA